MKTLLAFLILAAALVACPSFAADKAPVNADTKTKFGTVSEWVRGEMSEGGRYSYVTPGERATVEAKLAEMSALFDSKESVANMTDDEKMRMFNDQEQVNAILNERDGERLVCKNQTPVGSHIPVRSCMTVAEMASRKRNSDKFMGDNERLHQRGSFVCGDRKPCGAPTVYPGSGH